MLTGELSKALAGIQAEGFGKHRIVLDFGGVHRGFGKVTGMSGSTPEWTIIEAGNDFKQTLDGFIAALAEQDPTGQVEMFAVEGDSFAYYHVGSVLAVQDMAWITAGSTIQVGG